MKDNQAKQNLEMNITQEDTLHKSNINIEEMKEFVSVGLSSNQHNIEVESKLENYKEETLKLIDQQFDQNSYMTEVRIKLQSLQTRSKCEEIARTYSKTTQEDLVPLVEQNCDVMNQCEAEIGYIKKQSQSPISTGKPIQVNCTGSESIDQQIPCFNGQAIDPHQFFNQVKRFCKRYMKKEQHLLDSLTFQA